MGSGRGLPETCNGVLSIALSYSSLDGPASQLLAKLDEPRKYELIAHIGFRYFNLNGWRHIDALSPAMAGKVLVAAVEGFQAPCRVDVAARISELLQYVDEPARKAIAEIASEDNPNGRMLETALAKID